MRRITDEEVLLVSGGGYLEEAMAAISAFFGGQSSVQCVPGATTNGGVTVTQSCGGFSATVTINGPGVVITTTTTEISGSVSGGARIYTMDAAASAGVKVSTTTLINGVSNTTYSK